MEVQGKIITDYARNTLKVIAVTSGKGGVGKTNVSINLSTALANRGLSVMLMDADLGLGNIDVLLGLHPQYNFSHVLSGDKQLGDILIKGPSDILIVPASSGVQKMAELSTSEHAGMIRAFSDLHENVDVMVIDTAAGVTDSVVSFSRAATDVLVVICDEPASLTDAYALIKILSNDHNVSKFKILTNMVQSAAQGIELFNKLSRVTDRFLDVTLEHIGFIPDDDYLKRAIQKRWTVVNAFPKSRSSAAFVKLANVVSTWTNSKEPRGNLEFFFERLIKKPSEGVINK